MADQTDDYASWCDEDECEHAEQAEAPAERGCESNDDESWGDEEGSGPGDGWRGIPYSLELSTDTVGRRVISREGALFRLHAAPFGCGTLHTHGSGVSHNGAFAHPWKGAVCALLHTVETGCCTTLENGCRTRTPALVLCRAYGCAAPVVVSMVVRYRCFHGCAMPVIASVASFGLVGHRPILLPPFAMPRGFPS